jgi:hypothetical protein
LYLAQYVGNVLSVAVPPYATLKVKLKLIWSKARESTHPLGEVPQHPEGRGGKEVSLAQADCGMVKPLAKLSVIVGAFPCWFEVEMV